MERQILSIHHGFEKLVLFPHFCSDVDGELPIITSKLINLYMFKTNCATMARRYQSEANHGKVTIFLKLNFAQI